MNFQLTVETSLNADHRPAVLDDYRKQLIDKGIEPGLAGEAAYILAYVDPGRARTEMEQQTITLAFYDLQWGGHLNA